MVWAITNGSYIFQDILKIEFDIYVPSHNDQSTKIGIKRVSNVSIIILCYCAIL